MESKQRLKKNQICYETFWGNGSIYPATFIGYIDEGKGFVTQSGMDKYTAHKADAEGVGIHADHESAMRRSIEIIEKEIRKFQRRLDALDSELNNSPSEKV
jgi:hypothetical protein